MLLQTLQLAKPPMADVALIRVSIPCSLADVPGYRAVILEKVLGYGAVGIPVSYQRVKSIAVDVGRARTGSGLDVTRDTRRGREGAFTERARYLLAEMNSRVAVLW